MYTTSYRGLKVTTEQGHWVQSDLVKSKPNAIHPQVPIKLSLPVTDNSYVSNVGCVLPHVTYNKRGLPVHKNSYLPEGSKRRKVSLYLYTRYVTCNKLDLFVANLFLPVVGI